jgi:hypothetical protein
MSTLEQKARPLLLPLIRGEPVELAGPALITIATWSVKTAMVFDATQSKNLIFFTRDECDPLHQAHARGGFDSLFPRNTFVWLAAYNGKRELFSSFSKLFGVGTGGKGKDTAIEGHIATISAGCFVTQVLVARLPEPPPEPGLRPSDDRWDRAHRRIWPLPSSRVRWPPTTVLDDEGLAGFAHRWPVKSTSRNSGR